MPIFRESAPPLCLSRRLRLGAACGIALSLFLLQTTGIEAGELNDIRNDVREGTPDAAPQSNNQGNNQSSRDSSCDDDCDDGVSLGLWMQLSELTFWAISSPFWAPPSIVGDTFTEKGFFPNYPYQDGIHGFMLGEWDMPITGYTAHLRTRFEYADNFDDLSRIGGRVLFEHNSRFGLDSSFNWYTEELSPTVDDQLALGDVNVTYRFAQSDLLIMRTGFGVNWMDDDRGTECGFNFTYGGDFFPVKPWVYSAEIDWGTLGATGLFHARATVGAQINRATVYTGYDFLTIGRSQTHGLVAGVELWF